MVLRRELKFYKEQPSVFWVVPWYLIGEHDRYLTSKRVSKILRETFENAGLTARKKVEVRDLNGDKRMEERIIYPDVKIEVDEYNFYLKFRMINGQTRKQWESKLDAFSQSLGGELVQFKMKQGVVELTIEHTSMDSSQVPYKYDDGHYLNVGYATGGMVRWNFDSDPHCLIVGVTGSGKSTFVRSLLVQFPKDWILKVVDGKFVEFTFLADMGYDVASSKDEFMDYVNDAQSEVDRRFRMLQEKRKNNYKQLGLKPYFLLVDEFIFLAEELSSTKKKGEEKSERDEMFGKLRDISLRGRAAGVFLILILQRPDSTFMPTVVRDNLMLKVVLKGSETAFEMAFGSQYKKLEPLEPGGGYYMIEDEPRKFVFPNYELEQFKEDLGEQRFSKELEGEEIKGFVSRPELE